jgi:stage IV sporulation protein FB
MLVGTERMRDTEKIGKGDGRSREWSPLRTITSGGFTGQGFVKPLSRYSLCHGPCASPPSRLTVVRPMIHFSIFGIPVAVQPFFWVTMALLGGALNPSTMTPEGLLKVVLFMLGGFISIMVHELGHALTIRHYKLPTSITLQAFGGYATYPSGRLSRPQNFLVTAGGPAAQLVLALIAHVLLNRLPQENGIYPFLVDLRWISVVWAVLNLLPVLPMDGGQLVNAVLGPAHIRITLWITIITGVLVGLLALKVGLFFLAIFLGMFAFQAGQALREIRGR